MAKIESYCFLHSLTSFAEKDSAKTAKKTASNAQVTLMTWETAPWVYCQRCCKMYVNATNQTENVSSNHKEPVRSTGLSCLLLFLPR